MYDILFVDDDISLRYIISKMQIWNYCDFRIKKQAKNGQEALELLESLDFDLVITDIRMPIIDGIELLELIRERNIDVKVMLVSTYSEFEYAKRGLQLGASDYIIKPLKEEDLREALDRMALLLSEKNREVKDKKIYAISNDIIERWTKVIIRGNFEEQEIFDEFLSQINQMGIENESVYPSIIKDILERISKELITLFPWLKYVLDFDFQIDKGGLKEKVVEALTLFKATSSKYMLYKYDSFINKVSHSITQNIESDNILDTISDEIGFSKDYIGKQFKNTMGLTLLEYCTLMKIEYAKKMLNNPSMKIYEVSHTLGYNTVDYFTKLFKKYTGETPTSYRKKMHK